MVERTIKANDQISMSYRVFRVLCYLHNQDQGIELTLSRIGDGLRLTHGRVVIWGDLTKTDVRKISRLATQMGINGIVNLTGLVMHGLVAREKVGERDGPHGYYVWLNQLPEVL